MQGTFLKLVGKFYNKMKYFEKGNYLKYFEKTKKKKCVNDIFQLYLIEH